MTTDKEHYADLLDRIYELEGLLQLAITRDDPPARLGELISRKISELPAPKVHAGEPSTPAPPALAHDLFYVTEEAEEEIATAAAPSDSSDNSNPSDNPAPAPRRPKVSGRAVFNLNDRFRFRRSLFGGSDADFSEAIASLPTFDSFDEASAWFYSDRGWNPEDPEVTAFMEVMKNYYL